MSNLHPTLLPASEQPAEARAQIALLPLLLAIAICIGISILPQLLVQHGIANHGAASLLFWAMSAGFIRGVGFIPQQRVLRAVFSTYACLFGIIAAAALMLLH